MIAPPTTSPQWLNYESPPQRGKVGSRFHLIWDVFGPQPALCGAPLGPNTDRAVADVIGPRGYVRTAYPLDTCCPVCIAVHRGEIRGSTPPPWYPGVPGGPSGWLRYRIRKGGSP